MVSLKRKVLAGLLIVDALVAVGISFNSIAFLTLQEWLWLNFLAVAFSLAIFVGLKLLRRQAKHHRRGRRKNASKSHGEGYPSPQLTINGETVKSGGERLIADYFHEHDIKYEYEKPANDSSNRRISRPDFYLPEYDVYVEYWGMVNAEERRKRQEYVRGMEWKMARYSENGLRFISIYPEDLGDLDSIFKAEMKK